MSVKEIYDAVINFSLDTVPDLVRQEIAAGTNLAKILNDGLIAPMEEVGRLFNEGEIFLPEMMLAGTSMTEGLAILKPYLVNTDHKAQATIVIGTVQGDLHDIGKDLVSMMLQGGGFQIVDLGIDVAPSRFVEAAEKHRTNIVALSALLTTTLPAMAQTVALLKAQIPASRIMVGGAPVTKAFADEIGADGYGRTAPAAVKLAKAFMD